MHSFIHSFIHSISFHFISCHVISCHFISFSSVEFCLVHCISFIHCFIGSFIHELRSFMSFVQMCIDSSMSLISFAFMSCHWHLKNPDIIHCTSEPQSFIKSFQVHQRHQRPSTLWRLLEIPLHPSFGQMPSC